MQTFQFTNITQGKSYSFSFIGGGGTLGSAIDGSAIKDGFKKVLTESAKGLANDQVAGAINSGLAKVNKAAKRLKPTKVEIFKPFCWRNLAGAIGGAFQAGASAGVAAGATFWLFRDGEGPLFRIVNSGVEVKLAIGVEALSLSAGALLAPPEFQYTDRAEFVRQRDTPPSMNFVRGPKW